MATAMMVAGSKFFRMFFMYIFIMFEKQIKEKIK
jgi:hypothetical protein